MCTSATRQRGSAAVTVLFILLVLTAIALTAASLTQSVKSKAAQERDTDTAATVAQAALAFVTEQWRKYPDQTATQGTWPTTPFNCQKGFLAITNTEADGWAEVTAASSTYLGNTFSSSSMTDAPCLGYWWSIGRHGRFCIIGVSNNGLGGAGKSVRILAQSQNTNYTFEAVICNNGSNAIDGVGTWSTQTWSSGSSFQTIGGGNAGTIWGNGNLSVSAGGTITGNAAAYGGATINNSGTISGAQTTNPTALTFPNAQNTVTNAMTAAEGLASSAWWGGQGGSVTTLQTFIGTAAGTGATVPTIQIQVAPSVTNWGNINGQQLSMIVQGDASSTNGYVSTKVLTLPPDDYAFARLAIDGATVVIQAKPGNTPTTLELSDLYVTNGGRLILDASTSTANPPFTILNQGSNQWQNGTGSNTVYGYNSTTGTWSSATALKVGSQGLAGTVANSSNFTQAYSGYKPSKGTGSYDEWQVSNNAFLSTVTSSPSSTGAEFMNSAGTDFVMSNGGYIMGGVQSSNLATLKTSAMSTVQTDFSTTGFVNPTGWIGWSGGVTGSGQARFNINAGSGTSTNASGYGGLTYGAYNGVIGNTGTLRGAFVGTDMSVGSGGSVYFDPSLAGLLAMANTEHMMARTQVANPPPAFFVSGLLGPLLNYSN